MEALLVTHLEKSPALLVWLYVFFRVLSMQNYLRMRSVQVLTESEHSSSVFVCMSVCVHVFDVCVCEHTDVYCMCMCTGTEVQG